MLAGCGPVFVEPEPPPLPPPDDPDATCATACENLGKLPDGCGIATAKCLKNCEGASEAEAEVGVRFPVGCIQNAKSCDEAWTCE